MLNKIIKSSFTVIGGISGFTLTEAIFSIVDINISPLPKAACFVLGILFTAVLFYFTANVVIKSVFFVFEKLERAIQNMTLFESALSSIGTIIGLIIANLVIIPVKNLYIIGLPLAIFANIFFGSAFFCIGIVLSRKYEGLLEHYKSGKTSRKNENVSIKCKLLDTSIIIDGRIVDILRTGFVGGEFVIPGFILEELRHIADSQDSIKRNKGRRGLDVLSILQKEFGNSVKIEDINSVEGMEVDDKLLKAAKELGGSIVTIDYNLGKVAGCQGIEVLNINDLANALKPIAIPGEEMFVQVIKDGRENGQGIAYLDDGTMIVVEGGKKFMGETIKVVVTSILQTSAGRMIFAKPSFQV